MNLHRKTFDYLTPSDTQMVAMQGAREAALAYASYLQDILPDGADRTYILRKLREVAMWANVAITRNGDGEPR